MLDPILFLIAIMISLVIISGFFSAAEISTMSINRYKLRHLVKKQHNQAIRVNKMLLHPDKLLGVVLIGNTLSNIIASMVGTLVGQRLHGQAGVILVEFVLTLLILIFSEMVPKTLAAIYPQQVAFSCSWLLVFIQKIFSPLVQVLSGVSNITLKMIGVSLKQVQKETLSGDELRSVVHEAGSFLPIEHKSMLISLLDLEQAKVEDIMIPKLDIVGIDLDQSWPKILDQLRLFQHTRVPLYRSNLDNLVGIVHMRSVLNLVLDDSLDMAQLLSIVEEPYFIPEATALNIQLLNFQKLKRRSCFVVDEYGDLQGLVTLEDILDEIVGDFTTDIAALNKDIVVQPDGSSVIDASITIKNLNRLMGWTLPSLGPRTLSGLMIEYLGYIPPSACCLKIDNYHIEILKAGDNIIKTVRIYKPRKK